MTVGRPSFSERRYAVLAAAVLCLAAFNLTFRLGSEIVTEWDESLYAISAWETFRSHNWVGTTFMGSLDYYNTKPPLNVWLIALAFKVFGPSLLSLRIWSIAAAWATVAIFQRWVRVTVGAEVALAASLILATSFGFIYDHAGRSGNTDALFTLLMTLTVVTLWSAQNRDWRLVWLGPIAATAFMLRGMAVLMPLTLVAAAEWLRAARGHRTRERLPIAAALLLFAAPVAWWMVSRWRLDEWRFISRIFTYDFAARTLMVIENHPGTPLYYLNILQRNQLEWLIAGVVISLLSQAEARRLLRLLPFWTATDSSTMLAGAWAAIALLIPTLMRTKLSWYLNSFYPPFALAVGWLFVRAVTASHKASFNRRSAVVVIFVTAFTAAETHLIWYSFNRRSVSASAQGVLLAERKLLGGQRVFRDHWSHSDRFVLTGIVGAEEHETQSVEAFLRDSAVGDYLVVSNEIAEPGLRLVRKRGRHHLFLRLK
jgi:4-amino-4-deoxy-L-arabinose transferase-like glycosyltransferase